MVKPGYLRDGVPPEIVSSRTATESKLTELLGTSPERRISSYQFYQERVEAIRGRIWTMLAWLAAADVAVLGFVTKELKGKFSGSPGEYFTIDQPLLALVLTMFGIILSVYMLHIIDDGTGHVESNWRRSDIALGKEQVHKINRNRKERRQNHAFAWLMQYVAHCLRAAHAVVAVVALLVLVERWSGFDLPLIR
jgi:hypothetical protein